MLGAIALVVGFNILRFLAYIKDEMLIVLGTSSSETALPQLMAKLDGSAAPNRWSDWWFPPATPSIWMAPISI